MSEFAESTATEVVETGASDTSADESLQSRMSDDDGYFFSQSTGTVSSNDGEPHYRADGSRYSSLEEFKAERAKADGSSQKEPVAQGKTPKQTISTPVNSGKMSLEREFYGNDGKLDAGKFLNFIKATPKSEGYNPSFKVEQAQQQQQATQGKSEGEQKIAADKFAELKEYKRNLANSLLAPLEKMAQHIEEGTPAWQELNREYIARKQQIDDLVEDKQIRLFRDEIDNAKTEIKSAEERKALMADAKVNISELAQKHFGSSASSDSVAELLFGTVDAKGKFTPGPAADVINMLFDRDNAGKEYKSTDEWKNAYNDWWTRTAANKGHLDTILSIARDRWVARNAEKYVDALVDMKIKERSKQQASQAARPTAAISSGINQRQNNGGIPPELSAVFGSDKF